MSNDYPNSLLDAMQRIQAIQLEAVPDADAVTYWPYTQETFPYFTNRLAQTEHGELSEDVEEREYTVAMRLIVGHWQSGYAGNRIEEIYRYVPAIEDAFAGVAETLVSTSYPDPAIYLHPNGVNITRHTGVVVFTNSGMGFQQVGVEFTLNLPMLRDTY